MESKLRWHEFRLWYGQKITIDELYNFRKLLFPILDKHKIENFLVLNEPEFMLFRAEVDEDAKNGIEASLRNLVETSQDIFSKVTVEVWSPKDDARSRILGAAQRIGLKLDEGKGWMIAGREPSNGPWVHREDDLQLKIREFDAFMTKVAGKFTRAYVEEMPRMIKDRWMLSVLLHLILNSISVDQTEEQETRDFPYV